MARRRVFRDYRPGHKGKFASEETFNRSQAQGVKCHVHREFIDEPEEGEDEVTVEDLFDYEDYDIEDLDVYEFHGSGDTGRRK